MIIDTTVISLSLMGLMLAWVIVVPIVVRAHADIKRDMDHKHELALIQAQHEENMKLIKTKWARK